MARRTQRPPTAGANHLEWLRLVEVSGPFLSLPVLKEALPQGLEADDRDVRAELKAAHAEWSERSHDRAYHTQWVRFVLARALEYGPEVLVDGPAIPAKLRVRAALHNETLQPDYAVLGLAEEGERPARLVIQVHEPGTDLERALEGAKWKASPLTRMVELLRGSSDSDLSLGLVTNGEQWVLVSAPRKGTTTFVTWHASLWFEEKIALQAFRTLLGVRRTLGSADDTLERLIERSAEHQHDVTIQLGLQVREAIELLVRRIDELDRRSNRTLLAGVSEKLVYEAAVTVMMRLVFVFYLEEQADLYFPVAKSTFYQRHYALSPLGATLRAEADRLGPDVLERRSSAWCRLLACFRAIHGGVVHEDMRLPAYGGHLFDPDRFPFLEGRKPGESWRTVQASPLGVDDATVLFVLEALQVLRVRDTGANGAETRRLSFRELGVEQIGNVYESLLDHTAKRATDAVVSLKGPKSEEPEIELRELEQCYDAGDPSKLVSFVKEKTGRSEPSITKDLEYEIEEDSARWLVACGNDRELYGRVKPVAGLVREDRRQQPAVYPKDSVYVTAGADRRSTGTHYTPPSLTEPIVQYTLEPLVYVGPAEGISQDQWTLRTPREILDLKVCDLACGSGAFLVQACRYLSERLREAWQALEEANPGRILVSPMGDLSDGRADERVISRDVSEREVIARRAVVDRCLYGVDVNPAAVEMAKLSLWLITLQRDRPFTFLDHAIKCGDSLLGVISISQIERFSLRPGNRQATLATAHLSEVVAIASKARGALTHLPSNDYTQIEEKHRLHVEAEVATLMAKMLANTLVAFELRGLMGKEYDEQRTVAAEDAEELMRKRPSECQEHVHGQLGNRRPLQWPLEFPEVFEAGGFDAIVSNPPFQGGYLIGLSLGADYRKFIGNCIAEGAKGSADLCAFFFLRACQLLRSSGIAGAVATNTIAQGDTRMIGLARIIRSGHKIVRAVSSTKWPGDASLEVAHVWFTQRSWHGPVVLDDVIVEAIAPNLTQQGSMSGDPHRLAENIGKAFKGTTTGCVGFVLERGEAERLINNNPQNRDVIVPFLSGDDFNSRPDQTPSRFVIDFRDWDLDKAEHYPECLKILAERVKPYRESLKGQVHEHAYWRFSDKRLESYEAIRGLRRVLFHSFTSKYLCFGFASNGIIYSAPHTVVGMDDYRAFAVLQSSLHEAWAFYHCSTMETRLRYAPSDLFDTFPFPREQAHETVSLQRVGEEYYRARSTIMITRGLGATDTYNRFHDEGDQLADITQFRRLHVEMDRAVATAYGWMDLEFHHGFHRTRQGVRFAICDVARRTVLDRLLVLNRQRYEEEVRSGLHDKKPSTSKRVRRPKPVSAESSQGGLAFDHRHGAQGETENAE